MLPLTITTFGTTLYEICQIWQKKCYSVLKKRSTEIEMSKICYNLPLVIEPQPILYIHMSVTTAAVTTSSAPHRAAYAHLPARKYISLYIIIHTNVHMYW